jgi:ADP-ribose pyrophosphatase YjhB (NUDIX family)
MANPKWLDWAQRLQALAQDGLAYTRNPFDAERFHQVIDVAAEIIASNSDAGLPAIQNLFDAQSGYMTPKVDIRGVVFKDEQVLLVRELADGLWTLPGGWVDVNEPPSHAVEREVFEESGYEVKAKRLMALYDRNKHGHPAYIFHLYKVYIQCELVGGHPQDSLETEGARFYPEDSIPPLSIGRTTPQVLSRLFELYRNPDLPADFD